MSCWVSSEKTHSARGDAACFPFAFEHFPVITCTVTKNLIQKEHAPSENCFSLIFYHCSSSSDENFSEVEVMTEDIDA